jgi:hypothetical protein
LLFCPLFSAVFSLLSLLFSLLSVLCSTISVTLYSGRMLTSNGL